MRKETWPAQGNLAREQRKTSNLCQNPDTIIFISSGDTVSFSLRSIPMTRFAVLGSVLAVCASFPAALAQDTAKGDLHTAGQDTKGAAVSTGHATKKVAHKTAHGTKVAARKTKNGTVTAGHDVAHGTSVAAHDTAHETKKIGDKIAGKPAPQD